MMRNFVFIISMFSFLMLNVASTFHCHDVMGDNATQIEQTDTSDILSIEMSSDCHSSGGCHAGSHVLSAQFAGYAFTKLSSQYGLSVQNTLALYRQYPPFQPPIT